MMLIPAEVDLPHDSLALRELLELLERPSEIVNNFGGSSTMPDAPQAPRAVSSPILPSILISTSAYGGLPIVSDAQQTPQVFSSSISCLCLPDRSAQLVSLSRLGQPPHGTMTPRRPNLFLEAFQIF